MSERCHDVVLRSKRELGTSTIGQHIHIPLVVAAKITFYTKPPIEIPCDRSIPALIYVHIALTCEGISAENLGSWRLGKSRNRATQQRRYYKDSSYKHLLSFFWFRSKRIKAHFSKII